MEIEYRDPQQLKKMLAPALKRIPVLPADDQERIRAALMQTGSILDPVRLDADGRVATDHGRTLVLAACDLGVKEVQVAVTDLDSASLILDELTTRRHFTKSAIAYLAYPLLETAWKASKIRRVSNLMPGNKVGAKMSENPNVSRKSPEATIENLPTRTIEEFAAEHGVERNLLFEAQKVHELFEENEGREFNFVVVGGKQDGELVPSTLRDWFEPLILRSPIGGEHERSRPMGLGAVVAACGFKISGKNFTGEQRPSHSYDAEEYWVKHVTGFQAGFNHWGKIPEKTKYAASRMWEGTLKTLPEELWELTLAAAEKRLRNQ